SGDLLWYPVEGNNRIRMGPDVLVAFGRPKGTRGSYKQWVEGGIAPQVVFEVLSPGNRAGELKRKFHFYQRHAVEEEYITEPANAQRQRADADLRAGAAEQRAERYAAKLRELGIEPE